ncbi:hypothetical protein ACKVMH_03170 [Lysobacter zhanggongensis]|uniref:Uncharacterized protein n=2 Tax=Lysobacter zhanggongensis TaxID=1774951 RepID=A0ABU7YMZ3_9GAMM
MKRIIAAVAIFLSAALAVAGEPPAYKPFPLAQVSPAQWETYRKQVHAAYGVSLRRFPDEHLEVLHSSDNVMHFAFTTEGHPAHPAWITRSAQNGSVDQIGYFAGKEEPFAKLFRSYLELTKRSIESVPDEPAELGSESGAGTNGPGA